MVHSTFSPFSSSTRNMAFGSDSTTVPSTRMASSFDINLHQRHPSAHSHTTGSNYRTKTYVFFAQSVAQLPGFRARHGSMTLIHTQALGRQFRTFRLTSNTYAFNAP